MDNFCGKLAYSQIRWVLPGNTQPACGQPLSKKITDKGCVLLPSPIPRPKIQSSFCSTFYAGLSIFSLLSQLSIAVFKEHDAGTLAPDDFDYVVVFFLMQ